MTSITDIFKADRAALAPLAGITGTIFRQISRRFGASPVMTEMVSSDGLVYSGPKGKTYRLLAYHEDERPIGFQLFGSEPQTMAVSAKKTLELGPDFIDINAGCPVKKVIGRGAGSALMTKPGILAKMVELIAKVSDVPVTVKIRSGWDFDSINAVEIASMCESAGAAAVIVHPRTRSQGFGGHSDWSIIGQVREALKVPVIGSGDINTPEDAKRMLDETGAHSVMIGRQAMGNPWIFRQVEELLAGKPVSPSPTIIDRLDLALEQLESMATEYGDKFAVLNMRKFFGWYSKGAREGATFRQEVFTADTKDEVIKIVRTFQEQSQAHAAEEIDSPETVES